MTSYFPEWNGGGSDPYGDVFDRRSVSVSVAVAEAAGEVGAARVAALAKVGRAAAYDMALLCQWEQDQLGPVDALEVPTAARLRLILNVLTVGYAAVVHTTTDALAGDAERSGL